MTETTINLSLNDPRFREIAEILGNETCKKILNLIAEKELTETEISLKLKIPLNTVDYNIKKLLKSGLIESSGHWWSVKGKKMPSYKVAEKKIVISPKSFSQKVLILPALIIGGVLSFAVKKLTEVPVSVMKYSTDGLGDVMATTSVAESGVGVMNSLANFFQGLAGWEWFLIGMWLGIIVFAVLSFSSRKLNLNGGKKI